MTEGLLASEQALLAARDSGLVDETLFAVLRRETLVCGVDQTGGAATPAVRELEGSRVMLAWTSAPKASAAGWTGAVAERTGSQVSSMLRGTGLGLAINVGHSDSVGLGPRGVEQLGGGLPDA